MIASVTFSRQSVSRSYVQCGVPSPETTPRSPTTSMHWYWSLIQVSAIGSGVTPTRHLVSSVRTDPVNGMNVVALGSFVRSFAVVACVVFLQGPACLPCECPLVARLCDLSGSLLCSRVGPRLVTTAGLDWTGLTVVIWWEVSWMTTIKIRRFSVPLRRVSSFSRMSMLPSFSGLECRCGHCSTFTITSSFIVCSVTQIYFSLLSAARDKLLWVHLYLLSKCVSFIQHLSWFSTYFIDWNWHIQSDQIKLTVCS